MIEIRKLTIEARIIDEKTGRPASAPLPTGGSNADFTSQQYISEIVQKVLDRLKEKQENS